MTSRNMSDQNQAKKEYKMKWKSEKSLKKGVSPWLKLEKGKWIRRSREKEEEEQSLGVRLVVREEFGKMFLRYSSLSLYFGSCSLSLSLGKRWLYFFRNIMMAVMRDSGVGASYSNDVLTRVSLWNDHFAPERCCFLGQLSFLWGLDAIGWV